MFACVKYIITELAATPQVKELPLEQLKEIVETPIEEEWDALEQASPREFKPYMEDHEYYDTEQASPTPDKCPKCGSNARGCTVCGEVERG